MTWERLSVPFHGTDLDPALLVVVAVVCIPLAEGVRALVAVVLGDDTPRRAGRLWRVDRNVHMTGTVLVPTLLALVGGVVAGWPGAVPVREAGLGRARRLAVASAGPGAHALLAGVGALLLPGEFGRAVLQINALTALLLLVPLPPLPGGTIAALVVPALGRRDSRWARWRRTEPTPWVLVLLGVVVAWHTVWR